MVEYDTPLKGQRYIQECKEQIQKDMITYLKGLPSGWLWEGMPQEEIDALCQIVADNFEKLED